MSEQTTRTRRLWPRRYLTLAPGFVLVAVGCGLPADPDSSSAVEASSAATARTGHAEIDPAVAAAVARGESTDVVVLLDSGESEAARGAAAVKFLPSDERGRLEHVAQALDGQKLRALAHTPASQMTALREYRHLPATFLRIHTPQALAALAAAPEVARIVPNARYEMTTDPNLALINQPQAAAAGKLGAGASVAVLDTGCDYTRAAFGCTSPGAPASCKVAYAADFAPNDNALDDNGHGTNVSGIVLAVAPSAKVIALDVFTGGGAYTADILAAINWTIANRAAYNIAAINMSLGGGSFTAACTTDAFASALASARSAGIVPVVASGNDAKTNALASPACTPAAVSVGAVYPTNVGSLSSSICKDATTAADKIACFSNSASFLTMLAPGVAITAAGITMSGTSQATPHVAGAVAVLHAAFPNDSADALVTRLTSTGASIKDARNNITKPRLDLAAALAATAGPAGTVRINGGATATKSATVTLTLATTSGKATQLCASTSSTCTAWGAIATSTSFALGTGDGLKTVRVWWRDAAGNVSAAPATATISLDTTAPSDGAVQAKATGTSLAISWSAFADATSGIASYKVVTGTSQPAASCSSGTVAYSGTALQATATIAAGKKVYVRVCAVDNAGNVSAGAVANTP